MNEKDKEIRFKKIRAFQAKKKEINLIEEVK